MSAGESESTTGEKRKLKKKRWVSTHKYAHKLSRVLVFLARRFKGQSPAENSVCISHICVKAKRAESTSEYIGMLCSTPSLVRTFTFGTHLHHKKTRQKSSNKLTMTNGKSSGTSWQQVLWLMGWFGYQARDRFQNECWHELGNRTPPHSFHSLLHHCTYDQ